MNSENSVVKCVPEKKLKFWLQTEVWEVFFFSECVIGKQKNIKFKKNLATNDIVLFPIFLEPRGVDLANG